MPDIDNAVLAEANRWLREKKIEDVTVQKIDFGVRHPPHWHIHVIGAGKDRFHEVSEDLRLHLQSWDKQRK